jgi:endonuclease G
LPSVEEALHAQQERAAARVADANEQRRQRIALLRQPGGMARADDPDRVATRISAGRALGRRRR